MQREISPRLSLASTFRLGFTLRRQGLLRAFLRPPVHGLRQIQRRLVRAIPLPYRWSGRPRRLVPDTSRHILEGSMSGKILAVFPREKVDRIPVRAPEGLLPPHLHDAPAICSPGRTVFELHKVEVGSNYALHVMDSTGALLRDLSPDLCRENDHSLRERIRRPRTIALPGRSLIISTPEAATNYGHWLLDLLPRLAAIEAAGEDLGSFDHVIADTVTLPHQHETLDRFGVPMDRIRPINKHVAFVCDSAVITSLRPDHLQHCLGGTEMRAVAPRLHAHNAPGLDIPADSRLWISRRNAHFRKLANEDQLFPILARHNFLTVYPERYTVAQQAALFASASMIAGPHSSAMCNWIFCRPSTPVLEIASPLWPDLVPWTVASHAKLDFYAITGQAPSGGGLLGRTRWVDFRVDPPHLEAVLSMMLSANQPQKT